MEAQVEVQAEVEAEVQIKRRGGIKEVNGITNTSPSTTRRLYEDPESGFPKPKFLGNRRTWDLEEVEIWTRENLKDKPQKIR